MDADGDPRHPAGGEPPLVRGLVRGAKAARPARARSRAAAASLALALLAAASFVSAELPPSGYIWVEGEAARRHNLRRHPWYDSVRKEALSGGEWLSHFGAGEPPEAEYAVRAEKAGRYRLWIRANPVAGARLALEIRGERREVDLSRPRDSVNIASDGKIDMRFVAWIDAGDVELVRGENLVRFRFQSENQNHGAIDCFVFSLRPFQPRGALKPGERSGLAEPGFFAWEPDADPFGAEALVDLRGLNERVAGEGGRVRREGDGFVLGTGERVRFWGANAGPAIWSLDDGSQAYLARRLAKLGVNLVRLHGPLYGSRDPAIDPKRLERLHRFVRALKDEGIYVALSFFFPLWFELDPGQRSFMVLFFDDEMQRIYFEWADRLLETPNPHTGLPLAKDPAVAIVEVVNEDSHFFWTFGKKSTTPARWRKLQALYASWLEARYGSLEKAFGAWGGAREEGDDPARGLVDLYGAWEMTAQGLRARPERKARVRDQVRFLAENMRGFYERAIERFRRECGYEGLVACGNWQVADPSTLDGIERWCYAAGDVIDRHGYFDHGHKGEGAGWSVRAGQEFASQSALRLEHASPIPYVATEGYPEIVSEIGWPLPNAYRAEFPFLASAYGALHGTDGIFAFAIGSAGWDESPGKFSLSTPAGLGCFPAAALVYRRGYVREAQAVVLERSPPESLFELRGSRVFVAPALEAGAIDPLLFYVGRVARSFEGSPADGFERSAGDSIDRERKLVRSATGELELDYGRGVLALRAPKAQGAVGFLGRAGRIDLPDAAIEMENDYGSVTIVSLDDRPIARSGKILIQTMTAERFYGFRATGPGGLSGRIEDVGRAPCGVEEFRVAVTLRLEEGKLATVVACDEHGYPTAGRSEASLGPGGLRVSLDSKSPYHVVRNSCQTQD